MTVELIHGGEGVLKQQWRLESSAKKSGDSFSFDEEVDKIASTSSAHQAATPKKIGILKSADTPGTGQSVRFGKKLYDDGDESRLSGSTANDSGLAKSTSSIPQINDLSEDSVDMSLGFIRSSQKGTLQLQDNDSDISEDETSSNERESPTLQQVLEHNKQASSSAIIPPNIDDFESYTRLGDVSIEPLDFESTTHFTTHQTGMGSLEGDSSFNESFLKAEVELAKRHMEEEENRRRETIENFKRLLEEESVQTTDPTILAESETKDYIDRSNQSNTRNTPSGANTTQASEYMSTKSQVSSRSPLSMASNWLTPATHQASPENHGSCHVADSSSSSIAQVEDSPSVQRVIRRFSIGEGNKSISLARLQSFTNTPNRRSPLHTVIGSYPPSPWQTMINVQSSLSKLADHSVPNIASVGSSSPQRSNITAETQDTQDTLNDILQETNTLDSIHSERSEKLIYWAREAEEQSRIDRKLLLEERSKVDRYMREMEIANASLQARREEEERVEELRRDKLKGLEELVAKLYSQLDQKESVQEQAAQTSFKVDDVPNLQSEDIVNEEIIELRAALESAQVTNEKLRREQEDLTSDKDKLDELVETIRKERIDEMQEKEALSQSLQRELEALREARDQVEGSAENEKEVLFKQVVAAQEEQSHIQAALVKAEKEACILREENITLQNDITSAREQVKLSNSRIEEGTGEMQVLRVENCRLQEQVAEMRNAEQRSSDAMTRERAQLERKAAELEEENDNLLQSLAEVEDHRRTMEEDLLNKRDAALEESKAREEDALALAEEIQSRLEKVEDKLGKMTSRTTMLEHEVGDRGLEIVKLEKAKQRLEEDNLNYSIALSSKQQELNLLKRNGGRSLRNTPSSAAKSATRTVNSIKLSATRPSVAFATSPRKPLGEIQETAADESGLSIAALQSGPTNIKTMRRKTMDVDETIQQSRRPSSQALVKSRDVLSSSAMPSPMSTPIQQSKRTLNNRQKSPEEGTKVLGTSNQFSSRASSVINAIQDSLPVHSRKSSASSTRTIQAKAIGLSASIVASEGPMDISELQVPRYEAPLQRKQRFEEQRRDLQCAKANSTITMSQSPDLIGIPA